ncbi:TetR family transcriptional regulator [Nonomuraea sp. NPDC049152]|uniref:TetR/AcrR family transcriptional regulator n=1 Tax=Nonomuraea sp. NPDC049152 TaxID=3154350 RepID=UPI0033C14639
MTLMELLRDDDGSDSANERILDAAYERFLAFGVRRTTVDDVARQAGLARITVYRRFARKNDLVHGVMLRELRRFLRDFERAVAPLPTAAEQVVEGFAVTLRVVRGHSLLARLLVTEPETILPHLTTGAAPYLAVAREFVAAHLDSPDAEAIAEMFVRVSLSFLLTPSSAIPLETDDQARAFARRHLVPFLNSGGP